MIESLKKQQTDIEGVEKSLTKSIFFLEKETGHYIGWDYPYMKFLIELEELQEYLE